MTMELTKEEQKVFEDRLDMFNSDAWKMLAEEIEDREESINDPQILNSVEELWFVKGQLTILRWMLTLPHATELQYEQLLSEGE